MSVSASIFPSADNSHTSCSPSLWAVSSLLYGWHQYLSGLGTVFLEAYGCILELHALDLLFFFVVISLSQASVTMAMTTTPPVTVVCSGTASLLTTVTMAPSLMGLPAMSGQHDISLLSPLTPRDCEGVPQQQPQPHMPLQAYANHAMDPPQVSFSFRVEPPATFFTYVGVCSCVCFLLSGAMLDAIFAHGASTIGVCIITAFWSLPMAGICPTW